MNEFFFIQQKDIHNHLVATKKLIIVKYWVGHLVKMR